MIQTLQTMKKTIIANWGHAQQGKSDTVKRVARIILDNYPTATTDPTAIDFSVDIKVVITIDKIKIGIESQGDPNSRLFESLKEFAKINCDLIICSTRTSGGTVDAVSALHASDNYEIIWATNYRSNEKNQDTLNNLSARQIFELIQNLLTNKI